MKRDTINYFAVGLVVIVAAGVLLVALYRMTGAGGDYDTYYTYYRNVGGVGEGTPVTYEGYALGRVAAIEPEHREDGTWYRVELQVRPGWRMPGDSVARIHSEGLLADTVVEISEGRSSDYLAPGGTLPSEPGTDLFAALGRAAGEFGQLSEGSIRPLFDALRGTVDRIGGEVEQRLPVILAQLESMSARMDASAGRLASILDARAVEQSHRILDNTDLAAADFRQLTQSLASINSDITHLVMELDGLVSEARPDIQRSLMQLRHTLENLSRYSGDILMNMEGASRNMNEFSRSIRDNPGRLLGTATPKDRGDAP
ncbi:MAG TPA: MCE family protein [Gammaproteobacteria bacterium]|nr:MCE family protein [Gammaproteobacteria bacterium]